MTTWGADAHQGFSAHPHHSLLSCLGCFANCFFLLHFPAVFSVGLRPATLHAELFFQDLCMMGFFGGVIRNATSFPDYVIQGNPPPIPPIRYWGSFRVLPVLFVCLLSVLIF